MDHGRVRLSPFGSVDCREWVLMLVIRPISSSFWGVGIPSGRDIVNYLYHFVGYGGYVRRLRTINRHGGNIYYAFQLYQMGSKNICVTPSIRIRE